MAKDELVFEEHQYFRQWWNIALMTLTNIILIYVCITQLGYGKSWGNNPANNLILLITTILMILMTVWFFFVRLDTFIDKEGVYVRFFLIHFRYKFYSWDSITKAEVKKYRPIYSFGGWGFRYNFKSTSYSVSGSYALELKLQNGRKLLIGTQRVDELKEFLKDINDKRK